MTRNVQQNDPCDRWAMLNLRSRTMLLPFLLSNAIVHYAIHGMMAMHSFLMGYSQHSKCFYFHRTDASFQNLLILKSPCRAALFISVLQLVTFETAHLCSQILQVITETQHVKDHPITQNFVFLEDDICIQKALRTHAEFDDDRTLQTW